MIINFSILFYLGYNVLSVLPTPVFEFGGKKGHNVTVIAFQKKE